MKAQEKYRRKSSSSSSPLAGQVSLSDLQQDGYVVQLNHQYSEVQSENNNKFILLSQEQDQDDFFQSNFMNGQKKIPFQFKLSQNEMNFLNEKFFKKCKSRYFNGESYVIEKGISLQKSNIQYKIQKKLKKKKKKKQQYSNMSNQQSNQSSQCQSPVQIRGGGGGGGRARRGRLSNNIITERQKNQKQMTLEQFTEKQSLDQTLKKAAEIFKIINEDERSKIFTKIPNNQDPTYQIWCKINKIHQTPLNLKIIQNRLRYKRYKNYVDFHLDILHMIQKSYIFYTITQNQQLKKQIDQFQRFFWRTFNKLVVPQVYQQIVSKSKTKIIKMKSKDNTVTVKEVVDMEDKGNKFRIQNLNQYFKQVIEKDPDILLRYQELIQRNGEEANVKIVEDPETHQLKIKIKQISKDLFKMLRLMTKSKIDNIRKEELQEQEMNGSQGDQSDDFSVDSSSSDT